MDRTVVTGSRFDPVLENHHFARICAKPGITGPRRIKVRSDVTLPAVVRRTGTH